MEGLGPILNLEVNTVANVLSAAAITYAARLIGSMRSELRKHVDDLRIRFEEVHRN